MFRWPYKDDIAEVKSCFVFKWDFDVVSASGTGRIWQVSRIDEISDAYDHIKSL